MTSPIKHTFFNHYILKPLDAPSKSKKALYLSLTLLLGVSTLGMAQALVYGIPKYKKWRADKKIQKNPPDDSATKKAKNAAKNTLPRSSSSSSKSRSPTTPSSSPSPLSASSTSLLEKKGLEDEETDSRPSLLPEPPVTERDSPEPFTPLVPLAPEMMNESLFGHFLLDPYLLKSGLEGNTTTRIFKYLLRFLEANNYLPATSPIPRLLTQSIVWSEKYKTEADQTAQEIADKIGSLKEGEQCLVQGGYQNKEMGHAMLYLIDKDSFTFINTGDGIDFHVSFFQDNKTKNSLALTIKNYDKEMLSSREFWLAVLDLRVVSGKNNKTGTMIYEAIIPLLGDHCIVTFPQISEMITSQRSGTCSAQAALALMKLQIPNYKKFVRDLKMQALTDFSEFIKKEVGISEHQIRLFQTAIQREARSLIKSLQNTTLSVEEFNEKAQHLKHIYEGAQQLSALPFTGKTLAPQPLTIKVAMIVHNEVKIDFSSPVTDPSLFSTQFAAIASADLGGWQNFINSALEKAELYIQEGQYKKASLYIDRCISHIWLLLSPQGFTHEGPIDVDAVMKSAAQLEQMGSSYMKSFYYAPSKVAGRYYATQMMILLAMESLYSLRPKELRETFSFGFMGKGFISAFTNQLFSSINIAECSFKTSFERKSFENCLKFYPKKLPKEFFFTDRYELQFSFSNKLLAIGNYGSYLFDLFEKNESRLSRITNQKEFVRSLEHLSLLPEFVTNMKNQYARVFHPTKMPIFIQPNVANISYNVTQGSSLSIETIQFAGVPNVEKKYAIDIYSSPVALPTTLRLLSMELFNKGTLWDMSTNAVLFENDPNLSRENYLLLTSALVGGYPSKFFNILSLLKNQPYFLANENCFQTLINHLCINDLADSFFESVPEMKATVIQLILSQAKIYKEQSDVKKELQWLQIFRALPTAIIDESGTSVIHEISRVFRDAPTSTEREQRVKSGIATHLLAAATDITVPLDDAQIILLASAIIYKNSCSPDQSLLVSYHRDQIEEIQYSLQTILRQRDDLLIPITQEVIALLLKEKLLSSDSNIELSVKENDVHVVGTDFRVNVVGGFISQGDQILGSLPDYILSDKSFMDAIGDNLQAVYLLGGKHFECITAQGNTYRVIMNYDKIEDIERNFDGVFFKLVPFRNMENSDNYSYGFEDKSLFWRHQNEVYAENRTTGKIFARSNYQKPDLIFTKVNPEGLDDNEPLLTISNSTDFIFNNGGIILWGDKTLDFTYYNLSFTKQPEGHFLWNENPQFAVENLLYEVDSTQSLQQKITLKDQSRLPGLNLFSQFFLLRDIQKGTYSVMLPYRFDKVSAESNTSIGSSSTWITKEGAFTTNPVLNWDKVEKEHQVLELDSHGYPLGKTVTENLDLAIVYGCGKNWDRALHYLHQTRSGNSSGFTNEEYNRLTLTISLNGTLNDKSPEATAFALHALYLGIRNGLNNNFVYEFNQSYTEILKNWNENAAGLLKKYYNLKSHISPMIKLSRSEELTLLKSLRSAGYLSEANPVLQNQYRKIKLREPLKAAISSSESLLGTSKTIEFLLPIEIENQEFETSFKEYVKTIAEANDRSSIIRSIKFDHFQKVISKDINTARVAKFLLAISRVPRDKLNECLTLFNRAAFHKLYNALVTLTEQHPKEWQVEQGELTFRAPLDSPPPLFHLHRVDPTITPLVSDAASLITTQSSHLEPEIDASLLSLFDGRDQIPLIQTELAKKQEGIRKSHAARLALPYITSIDHQLVTQFEDKRKQLLVAKETLLSSLLERANQQPANDHEKTLHELAHMGKKLVPLKLEDLLLIYLQNNGDHLKSRNPALSEDEANQLMVELGDYLVVSIQEMQLTRVLRLFHEWNHEKDPLKNVELLQVLGKEIISLTNSGKTDATTLLFEYMMNLHVREEQSHLIETMSLKNDPSHIHQMLMGSGKSKVIMPLLALRNSTGSNIPIIMVPGELYLSNKQYLKEIAALSFNQEIETIELKENQPPTLEELKEIRRVLKRVQHNRSFIIMTSHTAHLLKLYSDQFDLNTIEENEPLIKVMDGIRRELLQKADVIVDEAHLVLDIMKQVQVALGNKNPVPLHEQQLISKLFHQILDFPELTKFLGLNKGVSDLFFDIDKYTPLIDQLCDKLVSQFKLQYHEDVADLTQYLKFTEMKLPPITNEFLRDEVVLAKELIHNLIPFALSKKPNVHYGLSQQDPIHYAIPYVRTNTPSEGSEFGLMYETMVYTVFNSTLSGFKQTQVKEWVENIKTNILRESRLLNQDISETSSYKNFKALNLPFDNPFKVNDYNLEVLVHAINEDQRKSLRLDITTEMVFPQIGTHNSKLVSTPINLVDYFHSFQGFSGTLPNPHLLHPKLQTVERLEDDGKTLELLWEKKCEVIPFEFLEDASPLLNQLEGYNALIDLGAWFCFESSSQIAAKLLQRLPSETIDGVVYFNDKDLPAGTKGTAVILERGAQLPKLIEASSIPLERRFTFYDITTGADVPQHMLAKAMVTVDKNITISSLSQAVWRLRKLEGLQTVTFAAKQELLETFNEPSLGQLLRYAALNEAQKQITENYKAARDKIDNKFKNIIDIHKLSLIPSQKSEFISLAHPFIVLTEKNSAYDLFGGVTEIKEAEKVINDYIQSQLDSFRPIWEKTPALQRAYPWDRLVFELQNMISMKALPPTLSAIKGGELGSNQHVQKQTDQNKQSEQEVNVDVNIKNHIANMKTSVAPPESNIGKYDKFSDSLLKNGMPLSKVFTQSNEYKLFSDVKAAPLFFSDKMRSTKNHQYYTRYENNTFPIFGVGSKPVLSSLLVENVDGYSMLLLTPDDSALALEVIHHRKLFQKAFFEDNSLFAQYKKDLASGVIERSSELRALDADSFGAPSVDNFINYIHFSPSYVGVFTPNEGFISSFGDSRVLNDPEVKELIIQTKFYSGVLHYNEEELIYMKEWMNRVGPESMKNMMLNHILSQYPSKKMAYPTSTLAELLEPALKGIAPTRVSAAAVAAAPPENLN